MLDYLPLVIILGGLGVMAYYLTRSAKSNDQNKAALAQEKGWTYVPNNSVFVSNIPDEERNISYRLKGKTAAGTNWAITARKLLTIEKDRMTRLELNPSTEWLAEKQFADHFLIMPHDGITIPDFILNEIFKRLGFPTGIKRLPDGALPSELSRHYAVYTDSKIIDDFLTLATPLLNSWWQKYPRKEKALIVAGSPNGLKIRTEMEIEKEADLIYFVETCLGMIV